ncbi:MAG: type II toxin-antitoxin system VapB family antitoxin [Actinomycetota bacterium]
MRTTINLPDGLAEEAKRRASEEGRTFTSLVEEGLRAVLDRPVERASVALPTHGHADDRQLVDLEDRDALWEALDADGIR